MTQPMRLNLDNLAEAAYVAYGDTTEWKNYQGLDMPRWVELGERIQNAWRAAALEIVTLVEDASRAAPTSGTSEPANAAD